MLEHLSSIHPFVPVQKSRPAFSDFQSREPQYPCERVSRLNPGNDRNILSFMRTSGVHNARYEVEK